MCISSSTLYMLFYFRPYYNKYYRLILIAVTTLAGEKIGTQKIKHKYNGLLLLDKSYKF